MTNRELNLLPPVKKIKLRQLVQFIFIKELLEFTILTCALLGIIYLAGWLVLTDSLNNLAASTTAINRDYSRYNQEIVQLNSTIRKLNTASGAYAPLTPKLLELATTLPPDIRLMNVTLDRVSKTITISGIAKTRAALLSYQTILSNLPWLKTVRVPTSDLFQKENLGFQITAVVTGLPPIQPAAPPARTRS